jgi:hypothetical protein
MPAMVAKLAREELPDLRDWPKDENLDSGELVPVRPPSLEADAEGMPSLDPEVMLEPLVLPHWEPPPGGFTLVEDLAPTLRAYFRSYYGNRLSLTGFFQLAGYVGDKLEGLKVVRTDGPEEGVEIQSVLAGAFKDAARMGLDAGKDAVKMEEAVAAIYKATIDTYTEHCTFYRDLNSALRLGKTLELPLWPAFVALMNECLMRWAEPVGRQATLYRGNPLPQNALEAFKKAEGKWIAFSSFTSMSENEEIAIEFSQPRPGSGDVRVIYEVDTIARPRISDASLYQREREQLFREGAVLQVVKVAEPTEEGAAWRIRMSDSHLSTAWRPPRSLRKTRVQCGNAEILLYLGGWGELKPFMAALRPKGEMSVEPLKVIKRQQPMRAGVAAKLAAEELPDLKKILVETLTLPTWKPPLGGFHVVLEYASSVKNYLNDQVAMSISLTGFFQLAMEVGKRFRTYVVTMSDGPRQGEAINQEWAEAFEAGARAGAESGRCVKLVKLAIARVLRATMVAYTEHSTFYRELNAVLREGRELEAPLWLCFEELLNACLARWDAPRGSTNLAYRGNPLPREVLEAYKKAEGQYIAWLSFTSVSDERGIAEEFSRPRPGSSDERVIFTLETAGRPSNSEGSQYSRGKSVFCRQARLSS